MNCIIINQSVHCTKGRSIVHMQPPCNTSIVMLVQISELTSKHIHLQWLSVISNEVFTTNTNSRKPEISAYFSLFSQHTVITV